MSEPKTLRINEVDYIRKDRLDIVGDVKIVILQRGWVFVGRFKRTGSDCTLTDAANIRKWGTEGKGLGEIAKNGPTARTQLDTMHGIVSFDYLTVVAMVDCDGDKWKSVL